MFKKHMNIRHSGAIPLRLIACGTILFGVLEWLDRWDSAHDKNFM